LTPLVIAHRGASWDEPENTLAAFERAIQAGADFVEFDVHATRDGQLVVVHDPPRATLPELRARRPEVPTLEETLAALRGRIGIMAELKRPYAYRGRDVVGRTLELLDDEDVVISFEARALEEVHRLRPRLRTVQHVGFGVSMRRAARYAWAAGFHDARATRPLACAHPRPRDDGLHGQRRGADARARRPRRHRHLQRPAGPAPAHDRRVVTAVRREAARAARTHSVRAGALKSRARGGLSGAARTDQRTVTASRAGSLARR